LAAVHPLVDRFLPKSALKRLPRFAYHNRRGNSVCSNNARLREDKLVSAVIDLLQRETLIIVQVLTKDGVRSTITSIQCTGL